MNEKNQKNMKNDLVIKNQIDVLVVGGGTAGSIAAIQSSRLGAKTFLLERGTQLGGTMTTGGVSFPGLFDAWGNQIIAGIGWDLVKKAVELDNGKFPDFRKIPIRHWKNQIHVNPFLYALLLEEECIKSGVEIAYYEFPKSLVAIEEGWKVDIVGPNTKRELICKQLIDCTGNANIVRMLGLPVFKDNETQPGSLLYKLGGKYDVGRKQLDSLYVHKADCSNSIGLTEANIRGRRNLLKKVRGSKKRNRLMQMQPEIAHRESYRIKGEVVITEEDYISGKFFKDAVCYAFYPIDLHTKDGVKPKPLKKGVIPTIPLRSLIPKNSSNFMVAGRCLSSDRKANSGLRVQAPCMAMGQVAGAASALAAQKKITPLNIPLKEILTILEENGAIIPKNK